ncbi:type VI secretion system-associated FHA domain protein TagH [Mesorhizobium sp. AaZ16]|uniref:type VI secretion system-associated FHA domain protein TagH n=1 Tax=Mesorhizobium sp. AaZ16 TaxID=3402289 RepID=UPI00374E4494
MTIRLQIDNLDALPDGGPLFYEAQERGFEIGREHRDWTLPDPNMFISGRHCEVRFEKGGYWLYDFSRNGTFVNGSRQRVSSPYRLNSGDRLTIGHYTVSVAIEAGAAVAPDEAGATPFASPVSDDIWETGAPSPPPISRRDLMAPQARGRRSADFSEQYLELPPIRQDDGFADRQPAPRVPTPGGDPFAKAEHASPFGEPPPRPVQPVPEPAPALSHGNSPFPFEGESFARPPYAAPPTPAAPRTPEPPAMPSAQGGSAESILRSIAVGAGISPDILLQRDPSDVAAEIGVVLRTVVEELALLLKARAAAKVLAKSANRTMISAVDNNPLKFVPRPEEVLEIMFARRRAGYLDAKHSIDEAFRDLKTHEFATYAAMQKALGRLLEDLSPEAIDKKVSGSAFASRKSRAWDTFVATWDAKEKPHENGMLDVFLAYFSDAYAKASKPK